MLHKRCDILQQWRFHRGGRHFASGRDNSGFQLVEALISVTIGASIMVGVFQSMSAMYEATSVNQNQVLASNMAQQIVDSARNCTYARLLSYMGVQNSVAPAGQSGAATMSQTIPLYAYPTSPSTVPFQRPLLRNQSDANMVYSARCRASTFNGTAVETLTYQPDPQFPATTNDSVLITVVISWRDQRGSHSYTTGTTISRTGIHN